MGGSLLDEIHDLEQICYSNKIMQFYRIRSVYGKRRGDDGRLVVEGFMTVFANWHTSMPLVEA